jgi:hypothetical protein
MAMTRVTVEPSDRMKSTFVRCQPWPGRLAALPMMLQGYDARMEPKPRRWWSKRLNGWQSVALYAGILLFLYVVKAYFPEQMKVVTDTLFVPFIILLAIIFGWSLYQLWRRELSQPRTRR